jgi:hypothetical protein
MGWVLTWEVFPAGETGAGVDWGMMKIEASDDWGFVNEVYWRQKLEVGREGSMNRPKEGLSK